MYTLYSILYTLLPQDYDFNHGMKDRTQHGSSASQQHGPGGSAKRAKPGHKPKLTSAVDDAMAVRDADDEGGRGDGWRNLQESTYGSCTKSRTSGISLGARVLYSTLVYCSAHYSVHLGSPMVVG